MSETFADFVVRRKAEIQEQIKALRAELNQLGEAEKLLSLPMSAVRQRVRVTKAGAPTLKEMALEVLRHEPNGADANSILQGVKERFGVDVPRSSMSPQLSRLGQEGRVLLDGLVWRLAPDEGGEYEKSSRETPQEDHSDLV